MKNVLVTGGAGYIGSHTCKLLHSQGYNPIVLDNLVYGHQEFVKWGEFYKGDQSDSKLIKKILEKHQISDIIHFSAYAYVGESVNDPIKYFENNTVGTLNLVKTAIESGVKNIVFSSTCATYGIPSEVPIKEDLLQTPINPYGQSKLMIEQMLKWISAAEDINYVALRYFNASGASLDLDIGERHEPETHLIPLAIEATLQGKPFYIFGDDYNTADGTCIRDFIHVMDLADAHIKALEYLEREKKSNVFNLGTGNGYSVKEIIQKIEEISGKRCEAVIKDRRPGDPDALVSSPQKAFDLLNWSPKYSDIDTVISSALNWHKKEAQA